MSVRTAITGTSSAAVAAALIAAAPSGLSAQGGTPAQPNIVFIMADDLGWIDGEPFGSQYYETPNLQRLRERGLYFTDAYAANPLCSPTRASIMTGKYPGRLNLTAPAGHLAANVGEPAINESANANQKVVTPNSRRQLDPDEVIIAELLNDVGYDTYFVGKWHLGSDPIYWPDAQGFDLNIGGAGNPGPPSYFSPYGLNNLSNGPVGEHVEDRLANDITGIFDSREAANDTDPFFLCYWPFSVHAPFQAKEAYMDIYRAKTDPRGFQDCPTMGGMIQSLDDAVGQVLDEIDNRGLANDTIIVFFSDNGGNMYNTVTDTVTGLSTTPTNNAPLRGGKATIYEGGHKVPAIVVWPGVTTPNTTTGAFLSSVDWYPTIAEWGGASFEPGQIVDGVSLVDFLENGAPAPRSEVYCHFPHYVVATSNLPSTSVRQGDWKLIRFYGEGPDVTNAYELYNLASDIGETTNLADANPQLVADLDALITQHLADTEAVIPFPNPAFSEPVGGWQALKNMILDEEGGMLKARLLGVDPYMQAAESLAIPGPVQVQIRMRIQSDQNLQVFWQSESDSGFAAARSEVVALVHDGEWYTYTVDIPISNDLAELRIDPGNAVGAADFDWIRVADQAGTTVLQEWDFGGPWDGSPFEPYLPNAGWSADNLMTLEELDGFSRCNITGVDPFMTSPSFGPHLAPVRVELRLRSEPANAGLPSQLMWQNSEGTFGVAAGRGLNFNQTHDGEWNVYGFDLATPDLQRLRFDPLQGSADGDVVDVDWIRVYTDDGSRASVLLEEWDFGGPLDANSNVRDWRQFN